MFTEIVTEIGDWATHLVFNPVVWVGVVLAGVSVVLFVVARADAALASGRTSRRPGRQGELPAAGPGRKASSGRSADDDDMAEIEALLRKRGIS